MGENPKWDAAAGLPASMAGVLGAPIAASATTPKETPSTEAESISATSRDPFPALDSHNQSASASRLGGPDGSVDGAGNDLKGGLGVRSAATSSGPHLEVGVHDPVLGYVELRAHLDSGGVHALLATQSGSSETTLEGHLGSLTDWMNSRHTPVESLTVTSFGAGRGHQDQGGGLENDSAGNSHGDSSDETGSNRAESPIDLIAFSTKPSRPASSWFDPESARGGFSVVA
jgi:hypothetical protein